jgi:hypothetical protein
MTVGGSAHLLAQTVQKLLHNPQLLPAFVDLHHDNHKKLSISECDGTPVIDS